MFDFNGTLVDDLEILFARTSAVFRKYGKRPPSLKTFRNSAPINSEWYYTNGIPREIAWGEICASFSSVENPIWNKVSLRPDALAVVRALRNRKIIVGIVSALNVPLFEVRVRQMKIRRNFDFLLGGQENKCSAFLEMMKKFKSGPRESFYIGDTTSDMDDADKTGIVKIAFAAGYNSPQLLLAKKPDFMVKSLSELLEIV